MKERLVDLTGDASWVAPPFPPYLQPCAQWPQLWGELQSRPTAKRRIWHSWNLPTWAYDKNDYLRLAPTAKGVWKQLLSLRLMKVCVNVLKWLFQWRETINSCNFIPILKDERFHNHKGEEKNGGRNFNKFILKDFKVEVLAASDQWASYH